MEENPCRDPSSVESRMDDHPFLVEYNESCLTSSTLLKQSLVLTKDDSEFLQRLMTEGYLTHGT